MGGGSSKKAEAKDANDKKDKKDKSKNWQLINKIFRLRRCSGGYNGYEIRTN